MKMLVTKINYRMDHNHVLVDIYGRGENKQRIHKILSGTRPYFYAIRPPEGSLKITGSMKEGKDIFGRELYKIFTRYPKDVADLREQMFESNEHYEANVPYDVRIRIDHNCFGVIEVPEKPVIRSTEIRKIEGLEIKPRYAVIDIETDGRTDPENPKFEVNTFSVYDSQADAYMSVVIGNVDKEKVIKILDEEFLKMVSGDQEKFKKYRFNGNYTIVCVKDEEELFVKLAAYFSKYQPDIAVGWYFEFDWEYLQKRCEQEKYTRPDFRSRETFDLMKGYSKLHEGENREGLDWCGKEDFGFGKIPYDGSLSDLYRADRDKFVAYNLWDVYLTEMLNKKRSILNYHVNMANMSACQIHKTIYNSITIDCFDLLNVHGECVLPTFSEGAGIKIQGGYVHDPAVGIFENLIVFDLKSEYPAVIRSFNLSPETRWKGKDPPKDPENYFKTPRGNYYKKEPHGLIPRLMDKLQQGRDAMKTKRDECPYKSPEYLLYDDWQRSFKELMNSFYGVLRLPSFRLADSEVAGDITAFARENVKWIIKVAQENEYIDIYADTDSVFIQAKRNTYDEILAEGFALLDKINATFDKFSDAWGAQDFKMLLQFEKYYERWCQFGELDNNDEWIGAKRYAGLLSWKDGRDMRKEPFEKRKNVMGFEVKRINVAPFAKKTQHKVFDMILTRIPVEKIGLYIRGVATAIKMGKVPSEMLAMPAKIGQEKYDPMPAFIRAAYYSREVLKIDLTENGTDYIWCYGYIKGKPFAPYATGKEDCAVAIPAGGKFPEGFVLNVDKMIERTIIGPLDSIVRGIGLGEIEDLISGQQQKNLAAYA